MAPQYADPEVSHRKFEREIGEFRSLEAEYRRRGWFLLEASFPRIRVLMAAPQIKPPALVTAVEFDYTNYDASPPSVLLVDAFSGAPYRFKDLPITLNRSSGASQQIALPGVHGGGIFINQLQPLMQATSDDAVPFLCMAGVKEYHDHPAHSGDPWELHRASGAGRLVRLLDVIYTYGVQPITDYAVQLVPRVAGFVTPQVPT